MIIEPYTWQTVSIRSVQHVSSDTVGVQFERPAGYMFQAGQYTIIRLKTPGGSVIMRQYSFSSAPSKPDLECIIQREAGGEASSWFHDLAKSGDSFEISQPFGKFQLPVENRPIICIAGRVGIAPFMSMLREARPQQSIQVLYSIRQESQICFRDELETAGALFFITGTSNRITTHDIEPLLHNRPLVYLCGSREFVEAMQHYVVALNIAPSDIKRELFTL